jgi:hypothetical protein
MAAVISSPDFRAVRAVIFAAVCVVTTGLGHALMSGDSLPGWALAAAFGGTVGAAWWLTGQEREALVVTGSTVVVQLGLHSVFSLSQPTGAHTPTAPATDSVAGMGMVDTGHGLSPGMFLAHTLAALVCGLWLWRGEAAAFQLGRSLATAICAPLRLAWTVQGYAGVELPGRTATTAAPVRRLRGVLLRYAVSRRGPPGFRVCC